MSQLLGILYKSRHFFLFLALQIICFYLMSKNNVYWDVSFFNTTNSVVARSLEVSQKANEFVNLGKVNNRLADENAALRKQLTDLQERSTGIPGYHPDSLKVQRFEYTVAKVVGSTHNLTDNFVTIDKGTDDGVRAGMGVISPQGVVGQVAYANKNYSRVYSILHSRQMVSAEVLNRKLRENNTVALGIAKWDGTNPQYVRLNTVDRFKPVAKGDSVVTSLQNPIFPPHVMVGRISEVSNTSSEAFHNISVRLSTDFSGLIYVYVVKNKLIESQQEVETNPGIK
ncbi:MAG: rod shape-determining protein MreC [Leadbetterella sp.]|nr:rod shape-determining protein MreC [Leadbetterella sp.]